MPQMSWWLTGEGKSRVKEGENGVRGKQVGVDEGGDNEEAK